MNYDGLVASIYKLPDIKARPFVDDLIMQARLARMSESDRRAVQNRLENASGLFQLAAIGEIGDMFAMGTYGADAAYLRCHKQWCRELFK